MRTILFRYTVCGMLKCCTITTDQLMDAIAVVESDRGATSPNVYQLRPIYVEDVCRITGQRLTLGQAIETDDVARWCIETYWDHYGMKYHTTTGKPVTAEILARMHNGGPDGWRRHSTIPYWRKVTQALRISLSRQRRSDHEHQRD